MKQNFLIFFLTTLFFAQAQNPYFEISKQMEIYNDVLKQLSTNYIDDVNFGDKIQKNTKSMLNSLDRFTTFYDEQSILDQKMRQEGHFGGMGINIQLKDSLILITRVFKDTPAEKQGLIVGDEILKIDDTYVYELSKEVASNILKGAKGSTVNLIINRNHKQIKKNIERNEIKLNAVTITKLINEIGYIRFVKFNKLAGKQVKKALLDLKNKGAKKIIIDARGNPGGLLNEVIKIVNFFIPKNKIVVTTRGRFAKFNKTYSTKNESVDEEIPLVILVNKRSASASEILSGSLQDYDRAVIVGDTTYGKGLVQRTYKLRYGTYMKQTISKYYIPSGRLIQKIDYWHRDKNGYPLLMKDHAQEKDYKTTNGRRVHNLGGIIPDIVISDEIENSLIRNLLNNNTIFDFSTWYYYHQKQPKLISDLQLKDHDFELFIKFLQTGKFFPKSTHQIMLEKALKKAKKENSDTKIIQKYLELIEMYQEINIKTLRKNKQQILDLIARDLSYRYFYLEGYTDYILQHDKIILKAIHILSNPDEYNRILK